MIQHIQFNDANKETPFKSLNGWIYGASTMQGNQCESCIIKETYLICLADVKAPSFYIILIKYIFFMNNVWNTR